MGYLKIALEDTFFLVRTATIHWARTMYQSLNEELPMQWLVQFSLHTYKVAAIKLALQMRKNTAN